MPEGEVLKLEGGFYWRTMAKHRTFDGVNKKTPSWHRASRTISPDKLWKLYEGREVRLTVKVLPEEKREGLPSILLEGDRTSLEWLADFILASAAFERDCSSSAAPDGPGNIFFDKSSEFGIYIHRLPCMEKNGRPLA